MSNPPKIRIVCSHCRSESVTRDANASWNPDTQDWELEGVMDAAYCNDCGGECSLEEVPYRPRRVRGSSYEWVNRPPAVSAQVSYVQAELKALGACEHHYLVQLHSDTGAKTKHMNLSPAKLARIAEILAEDEEEG